jgi:hypothetical protein
LRLLLASAFTALPLVAFAAAPKTTPAPARTAAPTPTVTPAPATSPRPAPDRKPAPAPKPRASPSPVEAELAVARAQALRALEDPAAAEEAWRACAEAGERALRLAAPKWAAAVDRGEDAIAAAKIVGEAAAEPLYWTALGNMNLARQTGFSATLAANSLARGLMDRAAALDDTIDHGGPARALGAWFAALPTGSGGGAKQSRTWFERAREVAPYYQLTKLEQARTYAVLVQDRALFDRLLREVLAFDLAKAASVRRENAVAKREAKALRARGDRLF